MEIDPNKIFDAISGAEVSAAAKEAGAALVDTWVEQALPYDLLHKTLGVEVGFYIEPEMDTFVVGTIDRIADDDEGAFPCEWKSTKHETKTWNSSAWLAEITRSHQLSTYAAGMKHGTFLPPWKYGSGFAGDRVLVRAASKSVPPVLWPSAMGHFVEVSEDRVDATLAAYVNTARAIRAMRLTGLVPWQLPGLHCTNIFRTQCPKWDVCHEYRHPISPVPGTPVFASFSPGSQLVVQHLWASGKIRVDNLPNVVVLSSSTLSDFQQCPEKWRQNEIDAGNDDNSFLDVGTVLHAGLGAIYEQTLSEEK